jgi:ribonuclease BN (tRNA processing enzyme)
MKLTVLGSGTSSPHPARSSPAFWLETPTGRILLDCSASAIHRMAQERLDWPDLDAIWISHFHLDHCGGIAPFLFGMKHAAETASRKKRLRIVGPKGLRRLIEAFDAANNYRLFEQRFPAEVVEVEELEEFEIVQGVRAVAAKSPHTDESHAIHLRDTAGKTFVYTSDTSFSEVIAAFARKVDLLLMECSFVRDKPVKIHLELAEAIYLIRKAEPGRAVLTHFYSVWDDVDFAAEVNRLEPRCEVLQAVDGLQLDI